MASGSWPLSCISIGVMSYLDSYLETAKEAPALPTLRDLERDYITYLLGITGHNVTLVSRILDISRTAVYQKISRYNLAGPS
jgi:transcriptional regulator of acetoin/glycerol metabolism